MSHSGQQWARLIRDGATEAEVIAVIQAINELSWSRQANRAALTVACAQILAQNVTQATPDIAADIRTGIVALIDGFAMQSAIEEQFDEGDVA
jgi:hypothetical protein